MIFNSLLSKIKLSHLKQLKRSASALFLSGSCLLGFIACSSEVDVFGNLKEEFTADISSPVIFYAESSMENEICRVLYPIGSTVDSSVLLKDTDARVKSFNPGYYTKSWTMALYGKDDESEYLQKKADGSVESLKITLVPVCLYVSSFDVRTDMPYSVKIYLETLTADEYPASSYRTIQFEGTFGQNTSVTQTDLPDIPGFEKPSSIDNVPVAADGSSVVTVKYKRKSVKVDYTLMHDDGTSEPGNLTGRYGEALTLPYNDSVKGRVFKGWAIDKDGALTPAPAPVSYPAEDVTYSPVYELVKYKITYILSGAQNAAENPSEYDVETDVSLGEPSRPGWIFDGWYLDSSYTDPELTGWHKGEKAENVTLYAKWVLDAADAGMNFVLPSGGYETVYFVCVCTHDRISAIGVTLNPSVKYRHWFINGRLIPPEELINDSIDGYDVSSYPAGTYELILIEEDMNNKVYFGSEDFTITR